MNNLAENLKKKIRSSKIVIGGWITMADPIVAEILTQAGFDWIAVDMEHSALTLEQVQNHVRIIELAGLPALVRVGENNANLIKRVMDSGASGVIVPMVNSKEDALRAVQAVRYPPKGTRGVGLARAQGYGLNFPQYKKWVNQHSLVVIQIEDIRAVENLEEILQVEGIDSFIVGPYDLSGSLGSPGNFDDPKVLKALKEILRVAKEKHIPPGIHVIPPRENELIKKIKEGYMFIAFSLDILFLGVGYREALKSVSMKIKQLKRF